MNYKHSQRGFTVIELLILITFLIVAGSVVVWQVTAIRTSMRDDQRKVAINSMYYSLEEIYYKENGHYPQKITDKTLRSVDPKLLTDPSGSKLGESESEYRYEPSRCTDGKCQAYTLRADLQNEADYVKKNRDNK